MTVHVFIGAGPGNLHRALKIRNYDPKAKFVFIDDRLRPQTRDIDRVRARANIFRFENDEVTAKLLAAGVRQTDLAPLIYDRDFSVAQGFQSGDDRVFSNKRFTQIQIRDLQLLLLKTIDALSGDNKPLLIDRKIGQDDLRSLEEEVAHIVYENSHLLDISTEDVKDLHIHVATGALRGDARKNEIVYHDKKAMFRADGNTEPLQTASEDVKSLTVTALHGTTTFVIKNKITLDQLRDNQRSLDLTDWEQPLKKYGWNLVRPPRTRVFYANDILYIGAEIPFNMQNMDKEDFERQVTAYTREIARLVFPDLDINSLPVNPHLRSRFPTSRGERGDVLNYHPDMDLHWNDEVIKADVTVAYHGDSRYLPHYQTGSGFVTAFLQNELYAEIYSRNSFADLIAWAIEHGHLGDDINPDNIQKTYEKLTANDSQKALKAFQQELFMTLSRDIIDHNKAKVGRYFNAIHTQSLNEMGKRLEELLIKFNHYQWADLSVEQFDGLDSGAVVMELLKINNIGFLREVMPQLLNMDFSKVSDEELLHIRDMHFLDFKENVGLEPVVLESSEEIIREMIQDTSREVKLQIAATQHFETILADYNKVHHYDYKSDQFNEAARAVVIMEMLNRKGKNIAFVRQTLPLLINKDLSKLSDKEVLACRDQFTQNYPTLLKDTYALVVTSLDAKQSDQLIQELAGGDLKHFNKVANELKLPLVSKVEDAELIRKNLLHAAVTLNRSERPFYDNVALLMEESDSEVLIARLKTIAMVLDTNSTLHQRSFLSFFTGKHSESIHKFAADIERITEQYKDDPQQLKVEALNTMISFHRKLEEGSSRRTIEALSKITNEMVEERAFSAKPN
ncbi:hypothetical protein Lsha_1658 [Legionella shakespearei DSM 23087]|uniref:Uncharacterized protein n=2 Tax=Legionella shakespearei TaxID=45075 RepID=A0A0W0YSV3_9GAMM|nr:hypothetical protein Lsha_1658 [Legionella shakespearei DSM 23087]